MRAWDQQPGESSAAYRAARLYFEAGPGRSLSVVEAALRPKTGIETGSKRDRNGIARPSGTVRSWCARHRWVERAEAFDRHFDQVYERARAAEAVDQAVLLERRRAELAEKEWIISQGMIQRIAEMLRWPLHETRTEESTDADGTTRRTTIISPANWPLRDVAVLARVACDLQRQAVGLPTRMAAQPFNVPGSDQAPVDQTQADADNGRIPPELAEAFRREAARIALENAGIADAGPE